MIKGVNKQVLEISETQNGFFEKAIFFVKPEYASLSEERIKSKAEMYVNDSEKPPEKRKVKNRKAYLVTFLKFALASLSGAVAGGAFIFFSLLFIKQENPMLKNLLIFFTICNRILRRKTP